MFSQRWQTEVAAKAQYKCKAKACFFYEFMLGAIQRPPVAMATQSKCNSYEINEVHLYLTLFTINHVKCDILIILWLKSDSDSKQVKVVTLSLSYEKQLIGRFINWLLVTALSKVAICLIIAYFLHIMYS